MIKIKRMKYTSINEILGFHYLVQEKPFYLMNDMYYCFITSACELRSRVPKGFTSDGASIWKIFWFLIGCPHTPKYLPAAIVHDWFVRYPGAVHRNLWLASAIFRGMLLNEGVALWKANLMGISVTLWQLVTNPITKRWRFFNGY